MSVTQSTKSGDNENLAEAVTEVSERVTVLVREEIELAKAETIAKVSSLARGMVAVAVGAVFGVFALSLALETLAWGLASAIEGIENIWVGFVITTALLVLLTGGAFLFAWRKLRVGAPTPQMAIDEAKKIRETVSSKGES
jgi:uncharacterized small protein (DUF1192 family)